MITWHFQKAKRIVDCDATVFYGVGDCLSTDTKPTTGIYNGSALSEMDTGKEFRFNADAAVWLEIQNGGGGGGVDEMTYDETMEILNGGA